MPNYSRKMDCKPTNDIKRFRDITINAFQYISNQVNSLNFNDSTQFTAVTGVNQAYTGSIIPITAQAASSSFPFYNNVDNAGQIFGTSQGRTLVGTASITQPLVNDYSINDFQEIVCFTDTVSKVFTFAVTDGISTSTATVTLPLANTIYRVIYKPNTIGVQAGTSQSLAATTAGAVLANLSTQVILASTTAGNVTVFDTYTTSWINNLPGSVLSASFCCTEEISVENSKDTNDRTCAGVKVGEIITKEERKWKIKTKESDINSVLVFSGAQLSFASTKLGKQVFKGTTPTSLGLITINIGANRQIGNILVGKSNIQLVTSLVALQSNQGNYNSTSGVLTLNGAYHSGQTITVRAAVTATRLQSKRRSLKSGYFVYCEIPEYFEDGEIKTGNFYAQILDYTADFVKDNDTEYELTLLELPDLNGDYITTIE
jgi:hypothetical protein